MRSYPWLWPWKQMSTPPISRMGLYSVRISTISISVSLLWLPSECDGWWYWQTIQSVLPAACTAARSAASHDIWLGWPPAAYAAYAAVKPGTLASAGKK
jgi:hypothetical protein